MLAHETVREFAEEIIKNHRLEGMEVVLYSDGDHTVRQRESFGTDEKEIMVAMPLGKAFWEGFYIWGENLEENVELREAAIAAVVEDTYFRITDWKEQEEKRKKAEAFYEALIGLL